jgi:hypothetical protein
VLQPLSEELHASQQTMIHLQQQVQRAINTGSGIDVMAVAKETTSGSGSVKTVHKLTNLNIPNVLHLIRDNYNNTNRLKLTRTRFFLLFVAVLMFLGYLCTERYILEKGMIVIEKFKSGDDENIRVFALAHVDVPPMQIMKAPMVIVMYEDYRGKPPDAPEKKFTEAGWILDDSSRDDEFKDMFRRAYRRIAQGVSLCTTYPQIFSLQTYTKSCLEGPTDALLKEYLSALLILTYFLCKRIQSHLRLVISGSTTT